MGFVSLSLRGSGAGSADTDEMLMAVMADRAARVRLVFIFMVSLFTAVWGGCP